MLVGRVLIAQRPFRRPNYRDEIGRGGDVIERGPEMTNGMRQSRLRQMILGSSLFGVGGIRVRQVVRDQVFR
jgi:hypothetical protein